MILKVIGSLIIIVTCAIIGYRKGEEFVIRQQILQDITIFLRNLKNNIMYRRDTTQQAIQNAVITSNFSKLIINTNFIDDDDFQSQLQQTFKSTKNDVNEYLLLSEAKQFENTVMRIGDCNKQEEIEKLNFSITFFEEALQNAKIQAKVQLKLYKSLGLAAGVAIAILFL